MGVPPLCISEQRRPIREQLTRDHHAHSVRSEILIARLCGTSFGGPSATEGTDTMRTWWQDLRYAIRVQWRTPGVTAVAVATLALAIGATTTLFTVIDAVLLRPLGFVEPQRLAMVRPSSGSRLSAGYLHDWRLESRTFQDMAGWHDVRANLTGRGEPVEVLADRATANFFAVLGTPAMVGRTFTVAANLVQVAPEVVLSHGFWQRRYGADPDVIGQPITLDGEAFVIVGVMPEGFTIRTTELTESRAELWIPFGLIREDWTDCLDAPVPACPGMGGILHVVGRLTPDATVTQAQTELGVIARRIEDTYPSYSRDWIATVLPLHEATVQDVRLTLLVLLGAVAILLLIACANVMNLALTRAAARQVELAIRSSLGATRQRLVRQLLTESVLLAMVGGALGLVLAIWGTEFLVSRIPEGVGLPRTNEIRIDTRILGFASLVTMLTAILFGVFPAMRSTRSGDAALRDATRGSSAGPTRQRVAGAMVMSEVALAVILLAGAALLGRSFWELTRVQPGFESEQVLTMRTTLPSSRYDTDARVRAFGGALLERITPLPGIQAVGTVNYLPMSRFGIANRFEIEGRPETSVEDQKFAWVSVVGGRYFEAMGIPLRRGRLPREADNEQTQPVFVIDEELARRYWANDETIGARLTWQMGDDELTGEIIAVVGSVRWQGMAAVPNASAYFWFPQLPDRDVTIVARALQEPAAMARLIARQVRDIDPNQPVADIRPLQDLVAADLARPRFTMLVLGSFATAALLLAAIGLYGVIAFGVSQRTREIGVRVALGAQRRDVLRLVMRHGMLLVGTGIAIGISGALALGRVVTGLLYGVTPTDPLTLAVVALFLAAVAMLATYIPAQRATRVDPMVTLRAD